MIRLGAEWLVVDARRISGNSEEPQAAPTPAAIFVISVLRSNMIRLFQG
jgi:hypothetical protein